MKIIEIKSLNELKNLENSVGKESIILKIDADKLPCRFDSIDLKKFKGRLDISFANNNKLYKFEISTNSTSNAYFFKNVKKSIVTFSYVSKVHLEYQKKYNVIDIYCENDLEKAIQLHNDGYLVRTNMKKNIIIHTTKDIPNDFLINECEYTIITSSLELQKKLLLQNLKCDVYDRIIEVKTVEDLYSLTSLRNEDVYVNVNEDIIGKAFSPIILKDFTGNMVLNGNGHAIKESKIVNEGEYGGLFSSVNNACSISINDYHLEHVNFLGECSYGGSFIGGRVIDKQKYASPPGLIKIINSSVISCFFESKFTGSFIGCGDEFMDIYNSYCVKNFSSYHNIRKLFGNEGANLIPYSITTDKGYLKDEIALTRKRNNV